MKHSQKINADEVIEKDASKWVVVGLLGSPHGVKGWIRINSFTQPPENILDYQPWLIKGKNEQQGKMMEYEKVEHHAKGMVVLLKGITDRNVAAQYTQCEIAVERSQLPVLSENEYYWSDLEGLNVINQDNVLLGKVDHLFETGSNDVLVIKGEKQHLIPYLMGNTIINVDLENKTISVDWDPEF